MRKFIILSFTLISITLFGKDSLSDNKIVKQYLKLHLDKEISLSTFYRAVSGYEKIKNKKEDILTIIDYSKPSLEKRFYVIDLNKEELLYSTYVMHGKNSGDNYATDFSNIINSYKSSPGFFKTSYAYNGQFGYSLKLQGLEKGINDNAMKRSIVLHGSKYATPFKSTPMLSKSLGCPAIPTELAQPVIDKIKDGSVMYIHTDKKEYLSKSKI